MLSSRLGILGVLAMCILPAVGQAPSEPITPLTTTVASPRQHRPMKFHGWRDDGTVESENWSGYAVTGSDFTQANGSWTVPTVDCTVTPNTYSAFWVGIDGYSSDTVEQTGTEADCDGTSPVYYAWYEFYPAGSVIIGSVPVSPGNQMSAQASYSGSEFTTTITNVTTGKSFSKTATVSGAERSSGEWIAEAPCCTGQGGILPLSDFGTGSFGEDYTEVTDTNYATDSSTSGPISAFGSNVQEITMVSSGGADEAVPSALASDGTSFCVTWESEAPGSASSCGGTGPAVTLSPTSLKWGAIEVGDTSAAKKVTLTNSGNATLNIATIATSGDFALATVKATKKVTPCVNGGTVAAGASCEIKVTFTPTETGTRTGDVTFTDNAANSPQTVPLTGKGKD
jgi:hypothetical protein